MKIENIKTGDVFKNYKALCEALEVEPRTGGNAKKAHMNEIGRFLEYTKKGYSFIVDKVNIEPIRESVKVGGSRDHLPFSKDLELLLINLLLENGNKLIKSNSSFLRDLCMINSNYYEYFAHREALSNLLDMDINHVVEWYDATNASFKGYLETLLRKLENKKIISHEKVIMVVFVNTNVTTTATGHIKASDLMYYDAEKDKLIDKAVRPVTEIRQANDNEIDFILEIEGKLLEKYECSTIQEIFLKGKTKEYYKELSKILFNELNIKRSYKAHKIHINQPRLIKEKYSATKSSDIRKSQREVNNGIKDRVSQNAEKRQQKALEFDPFIRNDIQVLRASEGYLIGVNKLNNNLIDINNADNLKALIENKKDKTVLKTLAEKEYEEYVEGELPF